MSLPPSATLKISPFKVSVSDASLEELKTLLKFAKLPPPTYEGNQTNLGVTRKWIQETKEQWENGFDWRKHEKKINEFPQWAAAIRDDDGLEYSVHFVGVFSKNKDAIPLVLLHGWPGSFLEFLPLIPYLSASSSPAFHIIVPSLPGYTFSSAPPLDKDFGIYDIARLLDKLLVGLGFGTGYVAQGGDIGSMVARILGVKYNAAKLVHLNFCPVSPPNALESQATLTDTEKAGLERLKWFTTEDYAYVLEHGHRSSTIGIVCASNPLALLAWVGEKFLSWSDHTPPTDTILESITLWWVTETFPRSIYPYRGLTSGIRTHMDPELHIKRPLGYSNFAKELMPMPQSWVAATGNLVYYKHHEKGGHFAALEVPAALANDIAEFVSLAWTGK